MFTQKSRPPKLRRRVPAISWLLLAALALAVVPAAPALAAKQTAVRKLGRGLADITCSFLEVPGHIVEMNRERGPAWGYTLGFVEGLSAVGVRGLVGVYELLTAPFPIPAGYQPVIQPEFPWGYFDEPPPQHHR